MFELYRQSILYKIERDQYKYDNNCIDPVLFCNDRKPVLCLPYTY
ncbi:hypothetical protein RG47T_1836 [Mucilaginibacter polytrichastri]|uniref:Uncharacterized protein n=1 Tax=Mucilaginibacter polytrichastri TaxID=1302689 RepID=A0A1Q5ZX98_9SPHI|nr:hypothetical protein RG47T_1836 [Mucilaginibacter polytrichastri]